MSAAVALPQESRAIGRPPEYSDAQVEELLDGMRSGLSMRKACEAAGIPYFTAASWRARDPSFALRLASVREDAAHCMAQDALDIIDDPQTGLTNEGISWAKLRSGYRQWLASKYAPKVYGDKIDVQGDLTINIAMKRYTPEAIDAEVIKPE